MIETVHGLSSAYFRKIAKYRKFGQGLTELQQLDPSFIFPSTDVLPEVCDKTLGIHYGLVDLQSLQMRQQKCQEVLVQDHGHPLLVERDGGALVRNQMSRAQDADGSPVLGIDDFITDRQLAGHISRVERLFNL